MVLVREIVVWVGSDKMKKEEAAAVGQVATQTRSTLKPSRIKKEVAGFCGVKTQKLNNRIFFYGGSFLWNEADYDTEALEFFYLVVPLGIVWAHD